MQFLSPTGIPGEYICHLDGDHATVAHAADAREQIAHPKHDDKTKAVFEALAVRPGCRPDAFIAACAKAGIEIVRCYNANRSFILKVGA